MFPQRFAKNAFSKYVSILFLYACIFGLQNVSAQIVDTNARKSNLDLFGLTEKGRNCCGHKTNTISVSAFVPEYETYTLTGTYYTLNDNLTATLMLNNKGADAIFATPTFYSLSGSRLQLPPITVPAASYIDVDMHQLLAGQANEFREGSIKISYEGGNLQLGAQVKLVDSERNLIWAEQLGYTSKYISNRLESVWWLPYSDSKTRVVVSNTSSGPIAVSVSVDGTIPVQSSPAQITLAPWETRVIDIMRDLVGNENGSLQLKGGISITHNGNPGDVMARMFVAKPSNGYSATVNFIDPETTASQKWNGNGFRFRNVNGAKLDSTVAVRNNGTQPSRVKGKIIYTRPDGTVTAINLPEKQIAAGATKLIELTNIIENANVPSSVKYGGIELEYDSPKGTIITSVQSVSPNGEHVFQVPMFDPQKTPTSAGGYPWKANGDYHTILYIKNETGEQKKFTAFMTWEGGGYSLGVKQIKWNQTLAIDFRELRDSQKPDVNGNMIPLNLTSGQIAWSIKGSADNALSGRSEQISDSGGVSNTYDCRNHCQNVFNDGWIDPFSLLTAVGDFSNFVAYQQDINSYGQILPSYPAEGVIWESSETSVAVIDGQGLAESMATGNATIGGTWEAQRLMGEIGSEECAYEPIIVFREAPMEVAPRVEILRNGQVIASSNSASVEIVSKVVEEGK
ncbi:MAG: hypothetical protein ACRD6X_07605 [Pyrinomonadaceae bacterium]